MSARLAACCWAAIGGAVCAAMAPLEPNLLEEGVVLHVAERLLEGEHLYRDVRLVTGPVPYALVAALFALLGKTVLAARLLVVLLHAAACASVYALARRAAAGPWAHASAGALAFAPVLFFPLLSTAFYTTFASSGVFVAAALAVPATRSSRFAFAAGVAVALTALSKQSLGALLAPALLALVARFSPAPERGRRVLAYAGGGAAVAAASLGLFAALGDLGVFAGSLLETPSAGVFGSPLVNLWPPGRIDPGLDPHLYTPTLAWILDDRPGPVSAPLALLTQLLYASPFLALALLAVARIREPLPPAAWALGTTTFTLASNLFPRADAGHLSFAAPAALATGLALAPALFRASDTRASRTLARAVLILGGVATLVFGWRLWARSEAPDFGPRVQIRPVSQPMRTGVVPRVLRYLRENLREGEPVYVARTEPLVYFASGARNPTPFTGLLQVWGLRGAQEPETLAALEQVRFVVMSDADEALRTFFRAEQPRIQAYLERHFRLAPPFRGRRHPEAWLLVLERGPDRGETAVDLLDPALAPRAWRREGETRVPDPAGPVRALPTRKNRRPLAVSLGSAGGGVDFDLALPEEPLRFEASVGYRRIADAFAPDAAELAVRVSAGGGFERLASESLAFGRFAPGSDWRELRVDLSRYAGRQVTLRLEARPAEPAAGPRFAFWGSPRLARAAGPAQREAVRRLAYAPAPAPLKVEAQGDTRMAVTAALPFDARVCYPAAAAGGPRWLELAGHARRGPAAAILLAPSGTSRRADLGERWTELALPLDAGAGCATVSVRGGADVQAWLSTPRLVQTGPRRPWVVLYLVDTLGLDQTPFGGAPEEVAPGMAAFGRDGVVFRRAFATSSWTRPAVATLLTGLGPSGHRVFDRQDALPAEIPRLPVRLAEAGYQTAALSTNPNVLPTWGFMPGFDRFLDASSEEVWQDERIGTRLEALVERAADRPLFLYVHDNQPHAPYTPPPAYRDRFGARGAPPAAEFPRALDADLLAAAKRLHRGEVRASSDRFARLLAALERAGRYDQALVVLAGDHGELFGEHGELLHGRALYEEEIRVPLVIKPPAGAAPAGEVERAVSTEQVAPAILALLGLEPAGAADLLATAEDPAAPQTLFAELDLDGRRAVAAVRWPWKYLRIAGEERLFDLESLAGEARDLAGAHPERLAWLRAEVERRRAGDAPALWVQCVAGARAAELTLELTVAGGGALDAQGAGLERGDALDAGPGRVRARLRLRAPLPDLGELSELEPERAVYLQPDRDGLRLAVQGDAPLTLRVAARPADPPPALIGPRSEPLDATAPLDLAALRTAAAPDEPAAGAAPVCRLSHVVPPAARTAPETLSPELRERLRALGYLE